MTIPAPGTKRAIDAQLNMVPFIDLLSVLIAFLLMTSVWSQVAKIDAAPSPSGAVDTAEESSSPRLTVLVGTAGYTLTKRDAVVREIAKVDGSYDVAALSAALADERAIDPTNVAVTVSCDDTVPYEGMIEVMDTALERGLTAISVDGVSG